MMNRRAASAIAAAANTTLAIAARLKNFSARSSAALISGRASRIPSILSPGAR